ncbi:MAG: oligopeptide transporter, OPT family [Clostridioides sp.]|jgi:putative OPT family oligopeptide transporter|nr:oligopeptide transporter, OPT family [Clostridioides sp.]
MVKEEKKELKPYISADKVMPEFTVRAIVSGIVLAVIFGAANAYLGLRVGLTVSASIPAAVIGMAVIKLLFRKNSILESNMIQTIGSAGESLAAGAIFTIPALFLWADEGIGQVPGLMQLTLLAFCGGVLGVLFMVPLRQAIVVKEFGTLPFPEANACAEVLLAGEQGGSSARTVFTGFGISAVYKFLVDGLKLFPGELHYEPKFYNGSGIGTQVYPALLGVGYICGPKIASYMFVGGVTSWLVIMPLIVLFGQNMILFPSTVTIAEMWASGGAYSIWSNYIKYIGAGAVAAGGIMSLIKTLPLLVKTFAQAMKGLSSTEKNASTLRTEQDLDIKILAVGIVGIILLIWLVPSIPVNLIGAIIIAVFGFFFATVSSRLVGLVGSSNNPVSGMTIATLLIATMVLKATGMTGAAGMTGAISIGSIICIIAAIAGDTSQDLGTGYVVGATPRRQQIGEIIGVAASALAIGSVLYLLNKAWGYGTAELPAPQAMLMKMIIEGVMNNNLPWTLVFIGVFLAIVIEILGIPVLPFAVGLYLPIHLNAAIMIGGLIRLFIDKKKEWSEERRGEVINNGLLYSSGLIAGEGIIGIVLAILAIIPVGEKTLADAVNLSEKINFGNAGAIVFLLLLIGSILYFSIKQDKESA